MPKDYFKIENCSALSDLASGAKIHLIGICGVAMGQLAVALAKQGYQVSGSDQAFYEPMGSFLKSHNLELFTGYQESNIHTDYDLVVIGNAISYGHPEVSEVERLELSYTCFPKLLAELVIAGRTSIVVTGTHGKTTTSALIAQSLRELHPASSYFIGGVVKSLPLSLEAEKGQFSVVEGDEYDSAFFAKVPKFSFYPADICIINAVEFDHADIYDSLEIINQEFTKLVTNLKPSATLIACLDFPNLKDLIKVWKQSSPAKIITFGEDLEADCCITKVSYLNQKQIVNFKFQNEIFEITTNLVGSYNARNAVVSALALKLANFSWEEIKLALATAEAPKRRQEKLLEKGEQLFIEDFAHHPTAVKQTLKSYREIYPTKPLWAIFEPASNTSRRKIMEDDYLKALGVADSIIIMEPKTKGNLSSEELLSTKDLCSNLEALGKRAKAFSTAEEILNDLNKNLPVNGLVILMSNSSFGGLRELLSKSWN